ncbi:hypothetical protein [Novosphingobium olei]|uniref:Uncharacterized protein n=1 Tax=Novosphingobium olei TaxID=2728851 RepID=A0A7Y0BP68_9SPHN|nr:hypothetical protein [Novosphingobium olei]NML93835.1 hypothetical protein [Novosphingobium olei]
MTAALFILAALSVFGALTLARFIRRTDPYRCPYDLNDCTEDTMCLRCWGDWQW